MFDVLLYPQSTTRAKNIIKDITSSGSISSVTDFDIIKHVSVCQRTKFATMEHNKWRLDGSYRIFEDIRTSTSNPRDITSKVAYWSNVMSDDNGMFNNPPYITITMAAPQTSQKIDGLTIIFGDRDDFATNIKVTLYYEDDEINEATNTYTVNNISDYICFVNFTNKEDVFNKIKIEFKSTNKPNRFVRLSNIKMGVALRKVHEQIYDMELLECISIPSDALPSNTASFTIKATSEEATELYNYKYVELYRNNIQFGGYYIDEIELRGKDKYTIKLNDGIQALEQGASDKFFAANKEYEAYKIFQDARMEEPINDMLQGTELVFYMEDFPNTSQVTGRMWDVRDDFKERLTAILMSYNMSCRLRRNGIYQILRIEKNDIKEDITHRIFDDYKITKNMPVNSIKMYAQGYSDTTINYPDSSEWTVTTDKTKNYIDAKIDTQQLLSSIIPPALAIGGIVKIKDEQGEFYLRIMLAMEDAVGWGHYVLAPDKMRTEGTYLIARFDADTLTRPRNKYGYGIRRYGTYESAKRASGEGLPYTAEYRQRVAKCDFRNCEVTDVLHMGLYEQLIIATLGSVVPVTIFNPSIGNTFKKRDLEMSSTSGRINKLTVDGVDEINVSTGTYTAFQKLMDRYYKYNREFEGTILAEGLECGDTVSMNLRDVGYTTGTITQLEYNLTNKEIARAKIWLYESEAVT